MGKGVHINTLHNKRPKQTSPKILFRIADLKGTLKRYPHSLLEGLGVSGLYQQKGWKSVNFAHPFSPASVVVG